MELCPKVHHRARAASAACINLDGVLHSVVYGYPCSASIDPVEKKPVFHFLPGTLIFSISTVGCNLHCKNCQNWEISQANPEDSRASACSPEKLVALAKQYRCPSIAYTYTDPVVYYEYRTIRETGQRGRHSQCPGDGRLHQ
jgi:pyruvate formate lyase activating enzyme